MTKLEWGSVDPYDVGQIHQEQEKHVKVLILVAVRLPSEYEKSTCVATTAWIPLWSMGRSFSISRSYTGILEKGVMQTKSQIMITSLCRQTKRTRPLQRPFSYVMQSRLQDC